MLQVQLEQLTASFQNVTDDMRQRFVVDGQTVLDESIIGTSPIGSFRSSSLRTSLLKPSFGHSGTALYNPECHLCLAHYPVACCKAEQQP